MCWLQVYACPPYLGLEPWTGRVGLGGSAGANRHCSQHHSMWSIGEGGDLSQVSSGQEQYRLFAIAYECALVGWLDLLKDGGFAIIEVGQFWHDGKGDPLPLLVLHS